MRILVTGGCGFIGSHIVDELINQKHEVHVIDNLSTGKLSNLNSKAIFHEFDITNPHIKKVIARINPEVVYHHAAQIDVKTSEKAPAKDANINIVGTVHIVEACILSDVKKIIYASSAAIYGDPERLPIDESHIKNPMSCYGFSKYIPEKYLIHLLSQSTIEYTILRYANVYGERQDPHGEGGVVSIFYSLMKNGLDVNVYGEGLQTRDFIYIRDIVKANMLALTNGKNKIINISTNTPVSVISLFEKMRDTIGCPNVEYKFKPARTCDINHSYLSNHEARKSLNWTPSYSLEKGLESMHKRIEAGI